MATNTTARLDSELQNLLQSLRSRSQFCDIFFRVEEQDFDLHYVVLATRMEDYVRIHQRTGVEMAEGGGGDPSHRIILENFPGGSKNFNEIVKFCYADLDFEIQVTNVAGLFYAAKYFGMINKDNLRDKIESFLESKIFNECNSFIDAIYLYKASINLEEKYQLPDDLSHRCLLKFISHINSKGKCRASLFCETKSILDKRFATVLLQVMKETNVNPQDCSEFISDFILHCLQKKETVTQSEEPEMTELPMLNTKLRRSDSDDYDKEPFQILMSGLKPELISCSEKVLKLLDLEDDFFGMCDEGKLGFTNQYLSSITSKTVLPMMLPSPSLDIAKKCDMIFNSTSNINSKDPNIVQGTGKVLSSLVTMLVSTFQHQLKQSETQLERKEEEIKKLEAQKQNQAQQREIQLIQKEAEMQKFKVQKQNRLQQLVIQLELKEAEIKQLKSQNKATNDRWAQIFKELETERIKSQCNNEDSREV